MRNLQIILFFFYLTSCDFKSSEAYHLDANKKEKEGNYKDAIILLDKSIKKKSNNIKAILDRAVDKSILEDYKGAIKDYSKVIKLDSNNTLAYFNRARNKKRLENNTEALLDLNKAIQTKGNGMFYTDKVENEFYDSGFEYDVKMEEIKFERGMVYYNIDSFRLAFTDFNFSIQKEYELSKTYYWRGLVYLTYNMKKEGCNDLYKAKEWGNTDANYMIDNYCK